VLLLVLVQIEEYVGRCEDGRCGLLGVVSRCLVLGAVTWEWRAQRGGLHGRAVDWWFIIALMLVAMLS
jgi:hypothetical protein